MESNSKFRELLDQFTDKLNEQQWFQELKSKWEELDPQSRTYLQFAGVGAGILSVFFIILSSIWSVHSLKKELSEKRALLSYIQAANDELFRLKETGSNVAGKDREGGSWTNHFESLGATAGIDRSTVSVSSEKPGPSSEQTKEVLYEISLKHVNIKQIVRYAFALENGQRPVKLRNLSIETKNDPTGYLDASLSVSGFTLVEPK